MRGLSRLLALAAIVCGAAAIYNVFSDQPQLEGIARRVACATRRTNVATVCRLGLKQLARSPFKQAYQFTSPGGGGTVAVDCVRRWVLFGDFGCATVEDRPAP
jgi:hypothetical protein